MAKLVALLRLALAAGVAAASGGASNAQPVRPEVRPALALFQRLYQASVRLSRVVDHPVVFEVPDDDRIADPVYLVLTEATCDAFVAVAAGPGGRPRLAWVNKVLLEKGTAPSVHIDGHTLLLTIDAEDGRRASQADIERLLAALPLKL